MPQSKLYKQANNEKQNDIQMVLSRQQETTKAETERRRKLLKYCTLSPVAYVTSR